jgi:hypothetical protein
MRRKAQIRPHVGRSRNKIVFLGFLAIAAYFSGRSIGRVLQFLLRLLLLCPLLHMFHGEHGGLACDKKAQ